jgi:hypothetical protein
MKKILLAFALISFAAFTAEAQTCCSKGKSASADKTEASCTSSAAAKAAAIDENIEERVDAQTGKATYVRRTVDAATGEAAYTPVEYCSDSKRFINQSPQKEGKASCHDGEKAGKTSSAEGCCSSKEGAAKKTSSSSASCCSKDKASKASSTSVKLTKSEN